MALLTPTINKLMQKKYIDILDYSKKETLSTVHNPTKLSECVEQGMYPALEFTSRIRACIPLYWPDIREIIIQVFR